MEHKSPRVSIGLPVFNGEAYLGEAIDSILAQTFTDFELIISDNASDDGTPGICQSYVEADSRVRYFRNDRNLGGAWNYNQVFALSSGRYFKWAAHDDNLEPAFLQRCVDVLDAHPEITLCYPKTRIIDESGAVTGDIESDIHLPQESAYERCKAFFRRFQRVENFHCNPIFGLIRSDVLRQTALIGPYLRSDQILLAELALHGQFFEIPEFLFARRDHGERAMHTNTSSSGQAEWFSPANRGKKQYPRWTVFRENMRCVSRVPLPWKDKIRCYAVVIRTREFGRLLKEIIPGL